MARVETPLSSMIAWYDFTPPSTLDVGFVGGRVYRYQPVPPDVAAGISEAPSAGEYFNSEIKGQYAYTRIG